MAAVPLALVLASVLAALIPVTSAANLSPLPPEMANHTYLFIVGAHHSGTTILDLVLCQHPNISCLLDTHVPENEGQHLQHVYKKAAVTGGQLGYGFNPESHLTEDSHLINDRNRLAVFNAWTKYWDVGRPMLLEKSPPHLLKMRFLQQLFTKERTHFLMTLRHPLGAAHFRYSKPRFRPENIKDCGARFVEHWLRIYQIALKDMKHVSRVAVVQLEDFLGEDRRLAQGYVVEMERFLGQEARIHLREQKKYPDPRDLRRKRRKQRDRSRGRGRGRGSGGGRGIRGLGYGTYGEDDWEAASQQQQQRREQQQQQQQVQGQVQVQGKDVGQPGSPEYAGVDDHLWGDGIRKRAGARQLLEYHGDKHHVGVSFGSSFHWVSDWTRLFDMSSPTCQEMIARYEAPVNKFGYSLRNLTRLLEPEAFRPYLLKFEALKTAQGQWQYAETHDDDDDDDDDTN